MITITLTSDINGGQLIKEINKATGLSLGFTDLSVYDGGILVINADSSYENAIKAVVAAHVPRSNRTIIGILRQRIEALAGLQAKDLTQAQIRDLLMAIAYRNGAIDLAGAVKSYDNWGNDD